MSKRVVMAVLLFVNAPIWLLAVVFNVIFLLSGAWQLWIFITPLAVSWLTLLMYAFLANLDE